MNDKAINSLSMKFLEVQAELNYWEIVNFPLLKNTSSRQLYYSIIKEYIDSTSSTVLKELYFGDGVGVTDRALRLKLREFEGQGLIVCEPREFDRRSRQLRVTNDLMDKINLHATACQRIFSERFYFIEQ